jgi:hypothetical protein
MTGETRTFSIAAVVIVDDVNALPPPFMTRSGAGCGVEMLSDGFRALTTSLIARAWVF